MMLRRAYVPCLGVMLLVSSCAPSVETDGPLRLGGATGSVCLMDSGSPSTGFALGEVASPSEPIVVDDVRLSEPDGLNVSDSYTIPLQVGDSSIGALAVADVETQESSLWERRVPTGGGSPPLQTTAHNFVAIVQGHGTGGKLIVDYNVEGRRYQAIGTIDYRVASSC